MNWNPFKKKPKPVPKPPWDGQHNQLCSVAKRTYRFGGGADDHISGWVWWCTCGKTNEYRTDHDMCFTEREAIQAFVRHQRLFEGMETSFARP